MFLSANEIRQRLGNDIRIEPFDPDSINPNSVNLRLHRELLIYEEIVLDAAIPNRYRRLEIPEDGLTLQPGVLYLGRTVEYTQTHGLVPMVQGRSSLSRLGLLVNPAGSLGDNGYCGTWTVEMHCVQPVRIYAGMQVCQISYSQMLGTGEDYNGGKYQHSRDVQVSQMFRELGEEDDKQMELNFENSFCRDPETAK